MSSPQIVFGLNDHPNLPGFEPPKPELIEIQFSDFIAFVARIETQGKYAATVERKKGFYRVTIREKGQS